jgi:hypothetical protein
MPKTQFVEDSLDVLVPKVPGRNGRMDAGESVFLERQLESVESRLYEKKFRELKYRELIPISTRDGAGAQTITYYRYTKVGMAKIIANPADDLPRSDVFATRETQPVFPIATSFAYTTQDLRRAVFTGVPLEMFKVDAARRGVRELESRLCWSGDTNSGIVGLFGNTNIPADQAPAGASTSRLWSGKTADEILADVLNLVVAVRNATNGVHQVDTLLLPITQHGLLAGKPRSTISDTTILKFIMSENNVYGLNKVDWLTELVGSHSGPLDQAFAYQRDPEILELRIPLEMTIHPPQMRNLEFIVPVEAENGGVVVRYPLACRFLYNI